MMYVKSVEDQWNEFKKRYEETNYFLLLQLKKELSDLRQDNRSVVEFYYKLKQLLKCSYGVMLKYTCCNILKKLD